MITLQAFFIFVKSSFRIPGWWIRALQTYFLCSVTVQIWYWAKMISVSLKNLLFTCTTSIHSNTPSGVNKARSELFKYRAMVHHIHNFANVSLYLWGREHWPILNDEPLLKCKWLVDDKKILFTWLSPSNVPTSKDMFKKVFKKL